MFNEEGQYREHDQAFRLRECVQRCLDMIKELCRRVVLSAQELVQKLTEAVMTKPSPSMFHCIYSCAMNLSWLSAETNDPQYTTGKRICEDALRSMNARWELAGNTI